MFRAQTALNESKKKKANNLKQDPESEIYVNTFTFK